MSIFPKKARRQSSIRSLPLLVTGGLGASLASAFVFVKLADEVLEREIMGFDTQIVKASRKVRSPALDRAFSAVTALGEPWALWATTGLVALRWRSQERYADVATGVLGLVGSISLNQVLKGLFHRKRPALKLRRAHSSGSSFPSGHAMSTLATYCTFTYLTTRRSRLTGQSGIMQFAWMPVLVICVLVGASRVYLEVHYPTDVVAGWAAGTLWLTTCAIARSFMEPVES